MNLVGVAIFRLQPDQFFKNNEYIKYKTQFAGNLDVMWTRIYKEGSTNS